ncbi:hypothetical protein H7K20_26325 [Priestia aryabhattai]|uniref:DUF6440 family protein n=1 Tax=Priestia aryabhattai TaxID=412384 RepID=UPI001C8E02AC|nr:DUF6440 family protein [Priestia aryabhattai]MBY0030598.1 hypothetical protein [Priestia aryabhattai]
MDSKRFEIIYTQGKVEIFKVIRDKQTRVLYMLNHTGVGGDLTVMVDQEGKPLVDEDFKK